jgi:hypothetical protein
MNKQPTERALINRALAAYFRAASQLGGSPMQPSTQMVEHDGLTYVVLSNIRGTLAVYRVRTVNGQAVLKGLKRWPKEVTDAE